MRYRRKNDIRRAEGNSWKITMSISWILNEKLGENEKFYQMGATSFDYI